MKSVYWLTVTIAVVFALAIGTSQSAFAQANNIEDGPLKDDKLRTDPDPNGDNLREDHSDNKNWITKWYGPDGNYEKNGGSWVSSKRDLIDEGAGGQTVGQLREDTLSTVEGLNLTKTVGLKWKAANGGFRDWTVFELSPADQNNMNRGGPADNIDIYGMIVIHSPVARKAIMSPAHDQHAQIWINGEKWYNNSRWTGGARTILHNVEVDLKKGANVLLYRVSESGGAAYMNLHFDDETHEKSEIYPNKSKDENGFFKEIAGILDVDPAGKLTTTWADIKWK